MPAASCFLLASCFAGPTLTTYFLLKCGLIAARLAASVVGHAANLNARFCQGARVYQTQGHAGLPDPMGTQVYLVEAAGRQCSNPLMPPPRDLASPKGELCVLDGAYLQH